MADTALDVEHLFTLTAQVSVPRHTQLAGGPQGTRVAADVSGGTFEGSKLRGTLVTPGGDWVTMRALRLAQRPPGRGHRGVGEGSVTYEVYALR